MGRRQFASERLPRSAYGGVDAKITSPGLRFTKLKPTGKHGTDSVKLYAASELH